MHVCLSCAGTVNTYRFLSYRQGYISWVGDVFLIGRLKVCEK